MSAFDVRRYRTLYFAYGSNMGEEELKHGKGCSSAFCLGNGYLVHRKLVFNKRSDKWGRSANIIESYGDNVYGVLYDIPKQEEWEKLDRTETGYKRIHVRVRMLPGRKIVEAMTYEALSEYITEEGQINKDYITLLINGAHAHRLPADYIKYLESIPTGEL